MRLSVYLVNVLVIKIRNVNNVYFRPDLNGTLSTWRMYLSYESVLIVVILISIHLFV